MKKKTLRNLIILIAAIAIIVLAIFSFGKHSSSNNKKEILVGTSPGPYSDLFLKGIKPILEKEGYKVKSKSFSDLLNADIALNEGDIDLNVDQHTAYMKNFNSEKNGKLVALTTIPTVPTGIYPANKKSLKDVENGDKIAIPNDPSNTARAYRLLVKAGWITLKKGVNPIKATSKDIATNKYNLKITEMDSSTIPRAKSDFDYIVLPGSIAYSAKISSKKMLLAENVVHDYLLVAVTNKKNSNKKWAKDVIKAYHSKQFKSYVKKHNKSNYWVMPK